MKSESMFQNPVTIGVDIEDVARFSRRPFAEHERLYRRLFTGDEIAYCNAQRRPALHYTARFSVKEAAIKALVPYGRFSFRDFEVRKSGSGAPFLAIVHTVPGRPVPAALQVSLSHCDAYAVAMVIALGTPDAAAAL